MHCQVKILVASLMLAIPIDFSVGMFLRFQCVLATYEVFVQATNNYPAATQRTEKPT